jgi:hypothetical protein
MPFADEIAYCCALRVRSKHSSAPGFQFRFCLGDISFIDIGEDYFHALTNTPLGYPTSNAARRTSNHRDFAFELFHRGCSGTSEIS